MCEHVFKYPEDKRENYNLGGKTLIGVCKLCGIRQESLGYRGAEPIFYKFQQNIPYGETQFEFDITGILW
uniref:Uncharacterized protein n=1 Tax=viral metagenome TaxID=1070528 RepID=A0A6M3LP31_9ZZZZ